MFSVFQVPAPVKSLFDQFPLVTYPPVKKTDYASAHEQTERTFYFVQAPGAQNASTEVFKLGVYNVFEEPTTKTILASDPWCLYTQLALCKKNNLKLSSKDRIKSGKPQHSICVLSQSAAINSRLPIMVEGSSKRHVRSTESITEILNSRVSDPENIMYISLLDTVVYDCWLTQVLYRTSNAKFLELYYYKPGQAKVLDKLVDSNIKVCLMMRNNFYLRHIEIFKNIESLTVYNSGNIDDLISPLLLSCQKVLRQFQDLLEHETFFSKTDVPTYLDIKVASYITCILNLEAQNPLFAFVSGNCNSLLTHAEEVVKFFQ